VLAELDGRLGPDLRQGGCKLGGRDSERNHLAAAKKLGGNHAGEADLRLTPRGPRVLGEFQSLLQKTPNMGTDTVSFFLSRENRRRRCGWGGRRRVRV